jgi:hypothetical protein
MNVILSDSKESSLKCKAIMQIGEDSSLRSA